MLGFFDYRSDFFHRPMANLMNALRTEEETNAISFLLPVGRGWTDDALNLRFVMPAISEKDFTLTARGDALVLKGQRRQPQDFGEEGDVTYALPYGRFERMLTLPQGLDVNRMEAKFHHGVLDIKIPVSGDRKPITIPVKTEVEEPVGVPA